MTVEQLHILRWEKPPPALGPTRRKRSSRFDRIAAELRENAGVWAVIWEGPIGPCASWTTAIRGGHYECFTPAGSYDAATRTSGGRATVYACYVAEEAPTNPNITVNSEQSS